MGILTRSLLRPQQRWDLEDFNTALSALRADSHFYTKRVFSDKAYVLQGFTISSSFIGQPTADLDMTAATLINGNNPGDFSWWTAPESPTPITLPTGVGGLLGGRNYVELQLYAQDGTPLQRNFWDPTANSGAGVEFTQQVNTVTEIFTRVVINQTNFNIGDLTKIPLAIIDLDGSLNIRGIKDKRNMFYRLGKPDDIHASYTWNSRTEPTTTLTFTVPAGTPFVAGETVTFTSGATAKVVNGGTNNITVFDFSNNNTNPGDLVTGGTSGATATLQSYYESFTGADKDVKDIRSVITSLMNEIRVVKGTDFWYEIGAAASLPSLLNFVNMILAPISTGARFAWNGTSLKITDNKTSGQTTADPVAAIRIPGYSSDLILTRQDGTGGSASLTIPDKSILYVILPTVGTSRSYSESGPGVTNFQVADIGSFLPSDSHFILAYREGNKIIVYGTGELKPGEEEDIGGNPSKEILAYIGAADETSVNPQYTTTPSAELSNQFTDNDSLTQAISINAANINDIAAGILHPYQEQLRVVSGAPANSHEVTGPVLSGSTLTIPLNSRDSNSITKYKVGQGGLFVFLNGIKMVVGDDYTEIGSPGTLSNQVQTLQDLVVGDKLEFIWVNPQVIGTAALDQPFFVNYLTGQNANQIPVGHIYNMGTDRLQIWRDGLAMLKTNSVGDLIDRYQEVNSNSVNLSSVANPDEVFSFVNHIAPDPTVVLITGVTGTTLTVPTYVIGNKALRVFRNGLLMTTNASGPVDLKYVEATTSTVTLSTAAVLTDVFKIYIAGAPPTFRVSTTGITGTVITVPGGNSYVIGNKHLLVFLNGVLLLDSGSLGDPVDRYSETSTTQITLEVALVTSDLLEFIYV